MKIRTLIVDDMLMARQRIQTFLADYKEIEITGECVDGQEAIEAIKTLKPDLVFLDVQMPEVDGFEVIDIIGADEMPVVIFVTAYDEFALQAFEASALDYLLKPFNEERLSKAMRRAEREIQLRQNGEIDNHLRQLLSAVTKESKYLKRIIVKSGEQTILLPTDDIDWISAAGNYLELHTEQETYLIRERMNILEEKLNPNMFARIHRSTIVNLDRIKTLHPLFHGDHSVILKDGTELNMSRTYHEKFILLLNNS